jgi:PAT family beta-lactamase induction signal transducer AmpG
MDAGGDVTEIDNQTHENSRADGHASNRVIAEAVKRPRRSIGDVILALRRPKVAVMLGLGFGSGLPFLLIGNTLSYWLGDAHVNLALIGFLSWVGMAYSLKFIWGAVVDGLPPPLLGRLGRRRGWLLWTQLGAVLGLLGMAASNPGARLAALGGFAVLTAFAAATQDVVVDAWRIEAAKDAEELDILTAAYKFGYQIAIILTGSVILLLAQGLGWPLSYACCALAMATAILATLLAPEPDRADAEIARRSNATGAAGGLSLKGAYDAVAGPFIAFFGSFGPAALLILLTVSAYHLCDYLRGPVINPFYVALGLQKPLVAGVRLAIGIPATILGIAAGGVFAARFGHMAALIVGGVLQPLAVAAFALLIFSGPSPLVFSGLMAFDDFSMNFAGVALIVYMSTLTSLGYTATQYALLTSALAWTGKFLKGFSGVWVLALHGQGLDMLHAYAAFFLLAGLAGIPALLLVFALRWANPARRAVA